MGREMNRVVWFGRAQQKFIEDGGTELTGAHRCTCPSRHPSQSRQHAGPELISERVERVTLL